MSSYQHKSCAQKRREKEKREKETSRGVRTLFDVWEGKGSSEVEGTTVQLGETEEQIVTRQNSEQSLSLETAADQGFLENQADNADELNKEPILQPSDQLNVRPVEYIKPGNLEFDIGMSPLPPASK